MIPAAALAARAWPLPVIDNIEALPFVGCAAAAASVFLLIAENGRALPAAFFVVFGAAPPLACAAVLDEIPVGQVFTLMITTAASALIALGAARLAPGAPAGLLFTLMLGLPPFLYVMFCVGGAAPPPWAAELWSLSPIAAASAGAQANAHYGLGAGMFIFIIGSLRLRRARRAHA